MGLKITKNLLYQILYGACIGVPYLDNFELTFVVWCFAAALTLKSKFSLLLTKHILSFAAIIVVALISSLYWDFKTYNFIRDVAYMLKPIVGILLGYQLCKSFSRQFLQTVIYTGVAIAIIHLLVIVVTFFEFHTITIIILRMYCGHFSDYEIYVLILLIFKDRFNIQIPRKRLIILTTIVAVSSFLYLARTNMIQFIILFMAMKGFFVLNRRSLTVISTVTIAVIIGYSGILYLNPKRNGKGLEAFLYKIKVAPMEPFKTKIDVTDYKDFNDNYRSYENINTVRQVTFGGTQAIISGKGLGSVVDLKQEVWLGDMNLRYISKLHNAFMTVFLKSGLIGVAILIYSIYLLFKLPRPRSEINRQIRFLFVGTGIFMIISNWVFLGFYFAADTKAVLIGFLLAYYEMNNKQEREIAA